MAFRWSETRKAIKTTTVSLLVNIHQVDPLLAGTKVELVNDPFDLASPIAVLFCQGFPDGNAGGLPPGPLGGSKQASWIWEKRANVR